MEIGTDESPQHWHEEIGDDVEFGPNVEIEAFYSEPFDGRIRFVRVM